MPENFAPASDGVADGEVFTFKLREGVKMLEPAVAYAAMRHGMTGDTQNPFGSHQFNAVALK